MKKYLYLVILIFSFEFGSVAQTTVIFNEGFESGFGDWFPSSGVWQVGVPSAGVGSAYSGQNVAATILDGNYPPGSDTRLIGPEINIPSLDSTEKILIRFWQWFNINPFYGDYGSVQISISGGAWQDVSTFCIGSSIVWSQYLIDITSLADSSIRLGFYFHSGGGPSLHVGKGWYVDEISIEKTKSEFILPESFESGTGDWYVEKGIWEIGEPTSGPGNAFSGNNLASTILSGNYPPNSNARLISPELLLKPSFGITPNLRFWHWYSINPFYGDNGVVQISVNGGDWKDISNQFDGSSGGWSPYIINLSEYIDSLIRIGFYFRSGSGPSIHVDNGWYIDSISIDGITNTSLLEHSNLSNKIVKNIYPNPFTNEINILLESPHFGDLEVSILDGLGRSITTLYKGKISQGEHVITWRADNEMKENVVSGIYYCLIRINDNNEIKHLFFAKQ